MPDRNKDVTKFSRYFSIGVPGVPLQALILILIGAIAGGSSGLLIHLHSGRLAYFLEAGIGAGIMIISLPAALTVIIKKVSKRRLKLKHAFFGVLVISSVYAVLIISNAAIFALLNKPLIAYLMLIVSNAGIYGYWFIVDRVVMSSKRKPLILAAVQPVLNIFFFLPVGKYILDLDISVLPSLVKLWAGMTVFMCVGYAILFFIDRPAKKAINMSGVDILSAMVSQWLYDITNEANIFHNLSTKKDIDLKVLAIRGRNGLKAVFAKPSIHYGPFAGAGGSIATEVMGKSIAGKYKATPVIMHGAVNMEDNPINKEQVYKISRSITGALDEMRPSDFLPATGSISRGSSGSCNALRICIGSASIIALTKAPLITEDMDGEVGLELEALAGEKAILIDAHNSRFESASEDELKGIYKGSKYIKAYREAIGLTSCVSKKPLLFGSSHAMLKNSIKKDDIGNGYTALSIFEGGGKRFCLVYFDANNMLPVFRKKLIEHIRDKYGMDSELCTTDTHSVNTLSLPASNVIGRHTKPSEALPIIDSMIEEALKNIEPVRYVYLCTKVKGIGIWGRGSANVVEDMTRSVVKTAKNSIPIIVALGFIAAAWIVYLM